MRTTAPDNGGAPLRAVDLFAGAGGLSLGLADAGFEVVAAIDSWTPALRSYEANFSHSVLEQDLSRLPSRALPDLLGCAPEEVDLVVGGPPCQGFSVQRIGSNVDRRNALVLAFADYVKSIRPRFFLMENVPGLLGKRGAALAQAFSTTLVAAGYEVRCQRVNAAEYGVPQVRRRVLFYGWRPEAVAPFSVFQGPVGADEYATVWSAIGDLPSPPEDFTPEPGDPLHRRMRLSDLNLRRLALIPPGGGFEHLPIEMRVNCHRDGAQRIGHRYVYGRLHPDEPAGTITARFDSFTRGKFAHPYDDRNITLREGARLQSFPDGHVFVGTQEEIAALIGNSVPPLMSAQIAHAIRAHLLGESPSRRNDQLDLWTAHRQAA